MAVRRKRITSLAKPRVLGLLGLLGVVILAWATLVQAADSLGRENGIEVISAGLGRTGGERLRKALDVLGYRTYHHMVFNDAGHHDLWETVYQTRGLCPLSIGSALDAVEQAGYTAVTEFPASLLYREMLQRHPDAKIILSIASSAAEWADDYGSTIGTAAGYLTRPPLNWLFPWIGQWLKFLEQRTRIRHDGDNFPVRDSLEAAYSSWLEEVVTSVPAGQLLMHSSSNGYPPLCQFLTVDECPLVPYPDASQDDWTFLILFARLLTFKWPLAPLLILALLCLLTYSIFMALWRDGEAKVKVKPAGGSKKTR